MTMFDTRPRAGPRWVGFPGQVRTVNVTGWPDGYLDARTYELHLFRQGHHTPVVVEVTQDDTTLTAEVTVPVLAGEWSMYLMEIVDDEPEPRLRLPFASSRAAANGPALPVDVPVEVVDGDELVIPVALTLVELGNGGGGGGGGTVDSVVAGDGIDVDDTDPAAPVVAADFGVTAGTVVEGDDARLSNARTPTAHAASHQDGGADELVLAGDYLLHDQTTPTASITVAHGFGKRPTVQVLISEIECDTDIEHVTVNSVSFVFPSPTAFKAILTT